MNAFVNEKINQIMQQVLFDESEIDRELYKNRLMLLYAVILAEIDDRKDVYDIEGIINQIESFEEGQLYFTEMNLSQYKEITPAIAFDVFSNTAFSLAVEHLKGKNYLGLSEMLSTVYQSLIDTAGTDFDKMGKSETLLDFNFASGNSEIMSLRLKMQWDSMK